MPADTDGGPATATSVTLGEAFAEYLQTLKPEVRRTSETFVRKYIEFVGEMRVISDAVSGSRVESYAEAQLRSSDPAAPERVAALKAWFQFLKKREYTPANYGVNIRVRKTGRPGSTPQRQAGKPIEMTAPELENLTQKLVELNREREETVLAVEAARQDGDLRENAGYHAARERLGFIDGQRTRLDDEVRRAVIVDRAGDERSTIGSTVTITNLDDERQLTYTLVNAREANAAERKISVDSPVGRELLGKRPSDLVSVVTPRGEVRFRVENVSSS